MKLVEALAAPHGKQLPRPPRDPHKRSPHSSLFHHPPRPRQLDGGLQEVEAAGANGREHFTRLKVLLLAAWTWCLLLLGAKQRAVGAANIHHLASSCRALLLPRSRRLRGLASRNAIGYLLRQPHGQPLSADLSATTLAHFLHRQLRADGWEPKLLMLLWLLAKQGRGTVALLVLVDRTIIEEGQCWDSPDHALAISSPDLSDARDSEVVAEVEDLKSSHALQHRHTPRVLKAIAVEVKSGDGVTEEEVADVVYGTEEVETDVQGMQHAQGLEVLELRNHVVG
mmetsp:Transcript_34731/g.78421  ORF Transcript_34731/g.78421 Transcript_34731/m.78421 type:complete len:283 (-) Transcript_34731:355-1203(-)